MSSAQTHTLTHRYSTVPVVRNMTQSSRPDKGLWFESVQPTISRSYLPDELAWSGVTLARSLCLFSFCVSSQILPVHKKHEHIPCMAL